MKQTILITGTLGFIGSNFIRHVVDKYPEYRFVGIDKAVKLYSLHNSFIHNNYKFYLGDIADTHFIDRIFFIEKPQIVINFSAESFVDAAERDVLPFIHSNIFGIQILINAAVKHNVGKLIHISTDEIYGSKSNIDEPAWTEGERIQPKNLYSASKGCSELILMANHYSYKFKYNITRSANVFGPRQKKDNLVPMIITSLMNDKEITIHGDGTNFRQYIFVQDKIAAIMKILKDGQVNEVYNIGDENYFTNLEMVKFIAKLMKKEPRIKFITNRLSHDLGYSVSSAKLRNIGWKPEYDFENSMLNTIDWYMNNQSVYE